MMSRWRMLPRHSLTTLQPPRRPTITDRPLRSTTQTRPSGFLTSGCPAGSTPLTHQPGPCLSTNLTRLNKFTGLKVSAAVLQLKARLGRVVRWSMFFTYPSPTRIHTHPHLITTVSGKGTTIHWSPSPLLVCGNRGSYQLCCYFCQLRTRNESSSHTMQCVPCSGTFHIWVQSSWLVWAVRYFQWWGQNKCNMDIICACDHHCKPLTCAVNVFITLTASTADY